MVQFLQEFANVWNNLFQNIGNLYGFEIFEIYMFLNFSDATAFWLKSRGLGHPGWVGRPVAREFEGLVKKTSPVVAPV